MCNSYSFMPIVLKIYRCFGHGLKICIYFVYNPQIIFCYYFSQIGLSLFIGIYYYQDMNVLFTRFMIAHILKDKH